MTVSDIVDGIIQKKNAIGMTNQQLSDASGVPKPTVDRVLRRDTPQPEPSNRVGPISGSGVLFQQSPRTAVAHPGR